MADKMLRVAGRGADGTAKPFSLNNDGNVEAVIKGLNVENDGTSSLASFRQDENGNGIMRVYMENKLSASDGDSVNVDGVLANKFLRFPSEFAVKQECNRTMLAKSNPDYAKNVLLDIKSPVEIKSFHVLTWGNLSNLNIMFYDAAGNYNYLRTPTTAAWMTNTCSLQGMGEANMEKYSSPMFAAKKIDAENKEWEFTNRDGKAIYFPYGAKIELINTSENEYKYACEIAYNRFEVML